jgi:hypothetical protein
MERAAGTRLTAFILRESGRNVTPIRGIYVRFRLVLAHEVRNQESRQRLQKGSREVVAVRVLAAPADYAVVRYVALLGLVVAFVFLWLLLR